MLLKLRVIVAIVLSLGLAACFQAEQPDPTGRRGQARVENKPAAELRYDSPTKDADAIRHPLDSDFLTLELPDPDRAVDRRYLLELKSAAVIDGGDGETWEEIMKHGDLLYEHNQGLYIGSDDYWLVPVDDLVGEPVDMNRFAKSGHTVPLDHFTANTVLYFVDRHGDIAMVVRGEADRQRIVLSWIRLPDIASAVSKEARAKVASFIKATSPPVPNAGARFGRSSIRKDNDQVFSLSASSVIDRTPSEGEHFWFEWREHETAWLKLSAELSAVFGGHGRHQGINGLAGEDLSTIPSTPISLSWPLRDGYVFLFSSDRGLSAMAVDSVSKDVVSFRWLILPPGVSSFQPIKALQPEPRRPTPRKARPAPSPAPAPAPHTSAYENTPAHLAVAAGSLEQLLESIRSDKSVVNAPNFLGWTPLHCAARAGSVEAIQLLLDHGADLALRDKKGSTPLQLALRSKRVSQQVVRLLKAAGAESLTLLEAAELGDVTKAALLIENGADVSEAGPRGFTPLHLAARAGHAEMCLFLVDQGARSELRIFGNRRLTALGLAAQSGRCSVVRALLEHSSFHASQTELNRALLECSVYKHSECATLLLQHSADPFAAVAGSKETSPEYATMRFGDASLVEAYRSHGVKVPLWAAARLGDSDLVQEQLSGGADPNGLGPNELTPLYFAVVQSKPDIAKQLIEAGATVDSKFHPYSHAEDAKQPLLALAVEARSDEIVSLLVDAGAKVDMVDGLGRTALYLAVQSRRAGMVDILLKAGASKDITRPGKPSLLKMASRDPKILSLLKR